MGIAADYPCPCCGYLVFQNKPGSDEICPICFWEDDISQLRFPLTGGGANKASLLEAQRNFAAFGAAERRVSPYVRAPSADDRRDAAWRLLDPERDNIEKPATGVVYGASYPEDS